MGYSSGQRGQTVNLLAFAFQGSNPCPTTIQAIRNPVRIGVFCLEKFENETPKGAITRGWLSDKYRYLAGTRADVFFSVMESISFRMLLATETISDAAKKRFNFLIQTMLY